MPCFAIAVVAHFLRLSLTLRFQESMILKQRGLEKNITFPIEPKLYLGDLRLVLGLILLALAALIDSALMSRKLKNMQTAKAE